jgi:hypothetical protein
MLGISWMAAQLAASQEGLSSMSERVRVSDSKSYIRVWSVTKLFLSFSLRRNCSMSNAPSTRFPSQSFVPACYSPIILTVLGQEYKTWILSLRNILHCLSSSLLHSNIFLRTSFATTSICGYSAHRNQRPEFQINIKSQGRALLQVKTFCPALRLQQLPMLVPSRQTHSRCINCITYAFPLTAYGLDIQGSPPYTSRRPPGLLSEIYGGAPSAKVKAVEAWSWSIISLVRGFILQRCI